MPDWGTTTARVLCRLRIVTLAARKKATEQQIAAINRVWEFVEVEINEYNKDMSGQWRSVNGKDRRKRVRQQLRTRFSEEAFLDNESGKRARKKFTRTHLLAWGEQLLNPADAAANKTMAAANAPTSAEGVQGDTRVSEADVQDALRLFVFKKPEDGEAAEAAAANATDMAVEPVPVEALLYLTQIKAEFRDEPETYNEFLEIVKSFRSQQIDMPALIRRVSTLFVGHGKLIDGFSTFLPKGYGGSEGTDDDLPPTSRLRARTATEDIFGEPDSDEGDQDDAAEQAAKRRKESPRWDTVSM